jgi:hypothetical protein
VLIVVSLAIGGSGVGLVIASTNALRQEPVNVVNAFCGDVEQQHYAQAYGLLSSAYQAKVPPAQFLQVSDLLDHVGGAVVTCGASAGGAGADVGNTTAHVPAHLTRLTHPQISGTITLVREQNTWRIANPDALQDTDVAALAVAVNFCMDLTTRDYGMAYRSTSARYQSEKGTIDHWIRTFAAIGSSTGITAGFSNCAVDFSTYKHTAADQATVVITDTVSVYDEATGEEIASEAFPRLYTMIYTFNQAQNTSTWVVDAIGPVPDA